MGFLSSKFGTKYHNITYYTPERLTSDQARLRRHQSLITNQRKFLEADPASLSPANLFHLKRLQDFESKIGSELDARVRTARKLAEERPSIVKSPNYRSAMSSLSKLLQHRNVLQKNASTEKRYNDSKARAEAYDSRSWFAGAPEDRARTRYGTRLWYRVDARGKRYAKSPHIALPCISRVIRREVMFAQKRAGKGYRSKKRFNVFSLIGC